jgi:YkoP domain
MLKRSCVASVHAATSKGRITIFSGCHLTIFKWWDHTRTPRVFSMRRIENLPGANRHTRPLWAQFIFALDSWLRKREGVFEYCHKPDCILRAQLSRLSGDVLLSDGTFGRPCDRVIDLHLWNEQIPVIPIAGYSLAWGCRFNRRIEKSLRGLAQFLMSKPQLSDINIIRANTNLAPLHRIAARHGFEVIRDPVTLSPWEHAHRFGQNILCWLLTLACHSGRPRPHKFWRSRQVMYLSRRVLDCKYIVATREHNHDDAYGVA